VLHPPLPCLVTGGGLSPVGQWVAGLRQAYERGELPLPEGIRTQQLVNLLNRLGHRRKRRWNVRIMERYAHGRGVVRYLARYLRGGPIKNARLMACAGERVILLYRGRATEADGGSPFSQRLTVSVTDFLQRLLLHVPVPQARMVRSYGLYHATHAEALGHCRSALEQASVEVPAEGDWQTLGARWGEAYPERCPTCSQLLVCAGVLPRGGAPPSVWGEERAA
jgi:hypothetical protein